MAFHSYQFILVVLPACYVGFLLAHRIGGWMTAFRFLAVASIAFYAQWSYTLAIILVLSVTANYAWSRLILAASGERAIARPLLLSGIAGNLVALGYLRYANFLIDIGNQLAGTSAAHLHLVVPIGVSFYTFIQIGYLIDCYVGQIKDPGFSRYVLFATFFPCVTAGPLVQPAEMLGQMKDRAATAFNPTALAAGLTMFGMGLFKKVALADPIAPFADAVFSSAAAGGPLSAAVAWLGAVCYALQLYFDFSGYSDMAIGLGCMFGFRLPMNFNSPFKTTNISDFWRCWHMSMTRFFTTYVYTPLAVRGARALQGRSASTYERFWRTGALPAITTFLVAGIWHGAGWTFVVYGLIHGLAIAIYLAWSRLSAVSLPPAAAWALTMSVVVSGLVVFRAPDLASAAHILTAMWTFGQASLATMPAGAPDLPVATATAAVIVLGAIVLLLPNTHQIMNRYWMSSDQRPAGCELEAGLLQWTPTPSKAVVLGALLCLAFGSLGGDSTFLYYQF